MIKLTPSLAVVATMFAGCLAAVPAQAQLSRTFVSAAIGNDANNCDRPTPCRTFQGAHDKTNTDGEITVLDPGGYGGVTITKSISIVNDGVGEAGILVSGAANGITVNGGPATYVNLRGITVQGIGFGDSSTGLRFNSGFSLTVTDCFFRNQAIVGFDFSPTASGTSNLSITNTWIADNVRDGVRIGPSAAGMTLRAAFDRVQVVNNGHTGVFIDGFNSTGTLDVSFSDSMSANNSTGFDVFSSAGKATTRVLLARSVVANNTGFAVIVADAPITMVRIGQSTITGNGLTFALTGAVLQSFGDNYIAGNANDTNLQTTIATK